MQKLINRDKVVAIIGEVASQEIKRRSDLPGSENSDDNTTYLTNPEVTTIGDYIFRVCFIDPFQATVMSKFAINSMKVKSCSAY